MRLSRLVGGLAIALPLFLGTFSLFSWILPNYDPVFHDTISHFYYNDALAEEVFVGTLVGLGLIMITYRGGNSTESRVASAGGVLAICVAMFPTSGWIELEGSYDRCSNPTEPPPGSWDAWVGVIHVGSAVLLFALLAYFCLVLFRRPGPSGAINSKNKEKRNRYYWRSGLTIVGCMLAIAGYWLVGDDAKCSEARLWSDLNLTFVFEAIALIAFGFSWLVRSRGMGKWLLDKDQAAWLGHMESPAAK
ncbi:MAG: hypothetical protein AAF697_00050 [Pseudomonadota bacterium]